MHRLSSENTTNTDHALTAVPAQAPHSTGSVLAEESSHVSHATNSTGTPVDGDTKSSDTSRLHNPQDKSPDQLQRHCEALESKLSEQQSQLQQSKESLVSSEERLSQAQQQCFNMRQSLETLKQQHEITSVNLSTSQADANQSKVWLADRDKEIHRLKAQAIELSRELKEVTVDRDSLSFEMTDCHADNAKYLKRLRAANDSADSLQEENRYLIEQLRELRAKVMEISDGKFRVQETLDRERHLAGQAALDLEKVVARYKGEVERLQDLVLAMGHKHVMTQGQLAFLQQRAQARLQPSAIEHSVDSGGSSRSVERDQVLIHHPSTSPSGHTSQLDSVPSTVTARSESHHEHQRPVLSDRALASILSSVAVSSQSQRSKPTRRFTVNASHTGAPLTMEQRKYNLLMDQITVLQRGYDTLREEKITLESQLDLVQREVQLQRQGHDHHNYHEHQSIQRPNEEGRKKGQVEGQVKDQVTQEPLVSQRPNRGQPGSHSEGLGFVQEQPSPYHQPTTTGRSSLVSSRSPSVSLSSSALSSVSSFAASPPQKRLDSKQPSYARTVSYSCHQHRPPMILEHVDDWDVQQCSCCMGEMIEI